MTAMLTIKNLSVAYDLRAASGKRMGRVQAVSNVSMEIRQGEIVGLVGESGCGKSTLGKAIMGLVEPSEGEIILAAGRGDVRPGSHAFRQAAQMVFQDPYSALNPKRRIGAILEEARRVQNHKNAAENRRIIVELLEAMGFGEEALARFPHQFSGGQLQRIGIARAIINDPQLVICDEPVSALDVSIQSQILNLLANLHEEREYSYLFITHDLSVVRYLADRVLVMYLGEIVEELAPDELLSAPKHPYTQMLAAALPGADRQGPEREVIGELPSPTAPPSGCRFHPRCPFAMERCTTEAPQVHDLDPGRRVACHLYDPTAPEPDPLQAQASTRPNLKENS